MAQYMLSRSTGQLENTSEQSKFIEVNDDFIGFFSNYWVELAAISLHSMTVIHP